MLYRLGSGFMALGLSLFYIFYSLLIALISTLVFILCMFWSNQKHHDMMQWLSERMPSVHSFTEQQAKNQFGEQGVV